MAFNVQVGPPQISIHQGQTILISELDGQINWPSDKGLFFRDTRVISNWSIYANGEPWILLNGGAITYYAARIFLTNRVFATESGVVPERILGLTISRWIDGGMHEDIEITNNSMRRVSFQLEIAVRSDFADLFDVKSNRMVRRGRILPNGPNRDNGFVPPIATAIFTALSRFQLRNRPRKQHTRMAVSALKSISNQANDGILACCTRWKTARHASVRRVAA